VPVLDRLERVWPRMKSRAAIDLLVGTAAHETHLGALGLQQHPGPARGIYQIEPNTFQDLCKSLTERHPKLLAAMLEWTSPAVPLGAQLAGNLYFATAVARLNYWRKPFTMPADPAPPSALAAIWKTWWNTSAGKGTVAEWLGNYARFVAAS